MNILGLCGSLQARSSNAALLRAAAKSAPAGVGFTTFDSLGDLPHFNPDLEAGGSAVPGPVAGFRARLDEAGGVLIATPEYAHSLPGVLKNALDWVVGSGELSGKRVAVLGGAPNQAGGLRAQLALIPVLLAMDAVVVANLALPHVRKALDEAGEVADPATLRRIAALVRTLASEG